MLRIITDSASDIGLAEAAAMEIDIVPLKIAFADGIYSPEVDITISEFYEKLENAEELPSTSQAIPGDYLPYFQAAKEAGDSVVVVAISGALSGTAQSARIAKEAAAYDEIYIVDSLQAVVGQRLLVEYAVELRKEGKSAGEIAAILTEARGRVTLWGMVDTLKYLHKGGRLSKSAALVGSMLKVKPVITVRDGAVVMVDKARGSKGGVQFLLRLIEEHRDFDLAVPIYFGYSGCDSRLGAEFQARAEAAFGFTAKGLYPVGATVGTHVGPGAIVIAYLVK